MQNFEVRLDYKKFYLLLQHFSKFTIKSLVVRSATGKEFSFATIFSSMIRLVYKNRIGVGVIKLRLRLHTRDKIEVGLKSAKSTALERYVFQFDALCIFHFLSIEKMNK